MSQEEQDQRQGTQQPEDEANEPSTQAVTESAPDDSLVSADAQPLKATQQDRATGDQAPSSPSKEAAKQGEQEQREGQQQEEEEEEDTSTESSREATQGEGEEGGAKKKRSRRGKKGGSQGSSSPSLPDVSFELNRLFELATKYPEVGAPLARLAMKIGYQHLGERLLTMQLNKEIEERGVEFYRVAADLARKEGRSQDVLEHVLGGVESVKGRGEETTADERTRLLHLVRLGFAVLLFDLEDIQGAPEFSTGLAADLPAIDALYEEDPFYKTLCAQALWFEDRERSEEAWEEAVALRDAETSWNSRGTWYKEADRDFARAEWAYRRGLRALPTSIILKHNLAQVLMDRVQHEGAELKQIRSWLDESEALLRQALRHERRHSMRRHINGNVERVKALQADLPREEEVVEPPPEVGQVVRGRVRSFKNYGVFLSLSKHYSGLLHISELAHERVQDPTQILKLGDIIEVKVLSVEEREDKKGYRIALSRKAILPEPSAEEAAVSGESGSTSSPSGEPRQGRGEQQHTRGSRRRRGNGGENSRSRGKSQRRSRGSDSGHKKDVKSEMGSLGELLLAKLEEKNKN